MAAKEPGRLDVGPEWHGSPIYGYDSPAVQQGYAAREAAQAAGFLMPHLESGKVMPDSRCGPGTITVDLAEAVAPGQVVGIDLEPGMIEWATKVAGERRLANVRFQVADICHLPFTEGSFDAVYTSSVLEHLPDPVQALLEVSRVLRPGGLIGVVSTEWSEPLISPDDEAVRQFFALFERGFNHNGGSLNRGRHLRGMLGQAGFDVTDFSASLGNHSTPEAVRERMEWYIQWMENLPLFDHAVEMGWVDRPTLDHLPARMRQWSEQPDAFLAIASCMAIGWKK